MTEKRIYHNVTVRTDVESFDGVAAMKTGRVVRVATSEDGPTKVTLPEHAVHRIIIPVSESTRTRMRGGARPAIVHGFGTPDRVWSGEVNAFEDGWIRVMASETAVTDHPPTAYSAIEWSDTDDTTTNDNQYERRERV